MVFTSSQMNHSPCVLDQSHFRAVFVIMLPVLSALFNPFDTPQDYLEMGIYNVRKRTEGVESVRAQEKVGMEEDLSFDFCQSRAR